MISIVISSVCMTDGHLPFMTRLDSKWHEVPQPSQQGIESFHNDLKNKIPVAFASYVTLLLEVLKGAINSVVVRPSTNIEHVLQAD